MSVKDSNLQYFLFLVPTHFSNYVSIYLEKLGRLQELFIVMFVFIAGFIHFVFWIGWTEHGQTYTIGK